MSLIPKLLLFSLYDTFCAGSGGGGWEDSVSGRMSNFPKTWTTMLLIYLSSSPCMCSFFLPRLPFHIAKNIHVPWQETQKSFLPERERFLETVKSGSHFEWQVPFPWLSGNLLWKHPCFQCLNVSSLVLVAPEKCPCHGRMLWNRAQCPDNTPACIPNSGLTRANLQVPLWTKMGLEP